MSMSKRILFIEDDDSLSKAYSRVFGDSYTCKMLSSGDGVLDEIKEWQPDLIILDLMIPGDMNGFEVLQAIQQDTVASSIPVIVATNLSDQTMRVLELGAKRCFIKSDFSVDELRDVIDKTLEITS